MACVIICCLHLRLELFVRGLSHNLLRLTIILLLFLLVQWGLRSWLLLYRSLLIGKFLTERFSMWFWARIVRWRNIGCTWRLNFGIETFVKVRALDLRNRFDFLIIELTHLIALLWTSATISINLLLKNCSCILNHHSMTLRRFTLRCRLPRLRVMLGETIGHAVADHKILFHRNPTVLLLCHLLLLDVTCLNRLTLLLNCFHLRCHLCLYASNFHRQLFDPAVFHLYPC